MAGRFDVREPRTWPVVRASAMAMLKNDKWKWTALLLAAASTIQPGCSTKAVGVDECRRIEYARCEAAPNCPTEFDVTDVEQCKLYYRDQCMHGLPLSATPKSSLVTACVNAIGRLSYCASHAVELAACEGATSTDPNITAVCKLLAVPEAMAECNFLESEAAATGGQAGSTGQSTGGTSGTGATAGSGGTDTSTTVQDGFDDLLGFGGLTG